MSREILVHPDPRLLERALEVERFGSELTDLAEEMRRKMFGVGVGLAAPQLGVAQRVIVIDTPDLAIALVNPVIAGHRGAVTSTEGCLSCPGLEVPVMRHREVHVRGYDLSGGQVVISLRGLEAVVAQHEIDHLNGKLIATLEPANTA